MRRWLGPIAIYCEPRVLAILFLGFSSGLPLALTGQTLAVWMRERGVSLATIGLFSLVGLPYVLKFLWAPLFDAVRVPLLGRLGRRRGWLVATQGVLILAVLGFAFGNPPAHPWLAAGLATLVAFCSASQDVMIDAFRVESLAVSRQAAGMANYVAGYRVAMLISTAGVFEITARFQAAGLPGSRGWIVTYFIMAALILVGTLTALCSMEPEAEGLHRAPLPARGEFRARFRAAVIEPFADFITRPSWQAILCFIVLYKLADALAGVMTAPFVLDIGFDKVVFGRVVKIFGFAATLIGGYAGGALFRALGTRRSLWLGGTAQTAAGLMFVLQAEAGAKLSLLILTIASENFTSGMGTVIFVAYLSGLCRNRAYTATQYALLSALAAVGRTLLAAPAGWLAHSLGWSHFFLCAAAGGVPGLVLLWFLSRPGGVLAGEEVQVLSGAGL